MSHNPQIPEPYQSRPMTVISDLAFSTCRTGVRFEQVLSRITMPFSNWLIRLVHDRKSGAVDPRYYIQVHAHDDACARTGSPYEWDGRAWLLREDMTDSEILRTAFLAVRGAVEHELFEKFLIDGKRPFDPHLNLSNLAEFSARPENSDEP
jgi:hypothetical protein